MPLQKVWFCLILATWAGRVKLSGVICSTPLMCSLDHYRSLVVLVFSIHHGCVAESDANKCQLVTAAAWCRSPGLLQPGRKHLHRLGVSLRVSEQTSDNAGPPKSQPLEVVIQNDVPGVRQPSTWAAGTPIFALVAFQKCPLHVFVNAFQKSLLSLVKIETGSFSQGFVSPSDYALWTRECHAGWITSAPMATYN